ncbi:unnamed protein product, partial [Meganyctiphanes norvegica]
VKPPPPPQTTTPASVQRSIDKADDSVAPTPKEVDASRFAAIKSTLSKLFDEDKDRSEIATLEGLKEFLKTEHPDEPFTNDEVDAAIHKMADAKEFFFYAHGII